MADEPGSIHASAVLIGATAVLIRGAAGAGKSRLAFALLQRAGSAALPFARLVGDDRIHLAVCAGRLLARPAPALAGRIEIRGLGIRTVPFEPVAAVGLVVDLAAADAARLPGTAAGETTLSGVRLPRLAITTDADPLPVVLASLSTTAGGD